MFSALASLVIAVAAVAQAPDTDEGQVLTSRAFGKTYKSSVDLETVRETPPWNEDQDSPPVPPRQAIKLADKMRQKVATAPVGWKWKAMSLSLFVGERHCFWYVMYQAIPIKPKEGPLPLHHITLIVMMDGTVIEPVVADEAAEGDDEASDAIGGHGC